MGWGAGSLKCRWGPAVSSFRASLPVLLVELVLRFFSPTVPSLSFVVPHRTTISSLFVHLFNCLSLSQSEKVPSMRNPTLKRLLATSLFVSASTAQTLDSVLSGETTLSTFYSLIQVCYQLRRLLGPTSDSYLAAISRHCSTTTF